MSSSTFKSSNKSKSKGTRTPYSRDDSPLKKRRPGPKHIPDDDDDDYDKPSMDDLKALHDLCLAVWGKNTFTLLDEIEKNKATVCSLRQQLFDKKHEAFCDSLGLRCKSALAWLDESTPLLRQLGHLRLQQLHAPPFHQDLKKVHNEVHNEYNSAQINAKVVLDEIMALRTITRDHPQKKKMDGDTSFFCYCPKRFSALVSMISDLNQSITAHKDAFAVYHGLFLQSQLLEL